jgi:hypothetical protein
MQKKDEGFTITNGRGFQVTFKNGYTVSVQFGRGNYCQNQTVSNPILQMVEAMQPFTGDVVCPDAEVAVWKDDGELIPLRRYHNNDSVGGYFTPAKVLNLLNWAAKQKKERGVK